MTVWLSFTGFLKRYPAQASAILMAAVFSVIVMMPSFLQRTDAVYPYQGIHMLGPDGEVYYAARVREVYDGFPSLGNVFFSAPKDQPAIQPPLPEIVIATTGRLTGANAITTFMASKAVLSFVVFLLFFTFLVTVTGSPWISLVSVTAVLFGGALLSAPWDLPNFLDPLHHDFEFLRFSRAINPQWSGSWFFIALIGLAQWIRYGNRKFLFLTAAATVVLIYSYIYAWTYVLAAVGLISLWYLIRAEWTRVLSLVLYWLIVMIFAMPYVVHMHVLSGHSWFIESSQRLGLVFRHGPLIFGVWLTVFLFIGFMSHRLWPRTWPLLPILPLAGFIALNQHLVTGRYIVPHHYHWYFIQPLASAFSVAVLLSILSPLVRLRYRVIIASLAVLVSIGVASIQQWRSYQAVSPLWGALQNTASAIAYIQSTMHPSNVVYTSDVHVADQVAIYTSADVYLSGNAANSLASKERFRYIYFLQLWLEGMQPQQVEQLFRHEGRSMLSIRLYALYYREAKGDLAALPDSDVEESITAYRDFFRMSIHEKLTTYPMSAVMTTPNDPVTPEWEQFLACTKEVFAQNGYTLRLMIPPGNVKSCL